MDVFLGGYTSEINAQADPLNDISLNPQLQIDNSEYIQVHDESSSDYILIQDFLLNNIDLDSDDYIGANFLELPPDLAPKLASNEACASSSTPACSAILQEASNCTLQPHVYGPSASITVYVTPPPSSTAVELECLPHPDFAEYSHMVINPLHHPNSLQAYNHLLTTEIFPAIPGTCSAIYDIPTVQGSCTIPNFHSGPILGEPSWNGLHTIQPVRKAGAPDYMLPAPAMDINNNQNADSVFSMEQVPQLMMHPADKRTENQIHVQSLGFPSRNILLSNNSCPENRNPLPTIYNMQSMDYMSGAVSDSEAMELTSAFGAAASTPSSYLTNSTGLPHHGISFSAPVSPSLNYTSTEAPQLGSFQYEMVEDKGSVHGGSLFANKQDKTQYYKVNDKLSWKKRGGITKRRQPSVCRSKSQPALHSVDPASIGAGEMNATFGSTGQEHTNPDGSGVLFRVNTQRVNLEDGYTWKKYGEKVIKKQTYTRTYLRCERSGCKVIKRTQRCSKDDDYVEFLYLGRHNHDP